MNLIIILRRDLSVQYISLPVALKCILSNPTVPGGISGYIRLDVRIK